MLLKKLIEKRNALLEERDALIAGAEAETRALNADEITRFEAIREEINNIDKSITAIEEAREYKPEEKREYEKDEQREEKRFLDFIKGNERALDVANNGAVIPTHIANKIIDKVKELCPIYSMATVYNVGGDLVFPVYDETTGTIGAAYVDDMQELTEGTGKFTSVKLQNFIIGCLAKVSKSLMNRSDFDLLGFIINKVAQAISEFLGKQLIVGTEDKMTGVVSAEVGVTSASATAITSDELIDLQDAVVEPLQGNACWLMHKDTRTALKKLKDSEGNYILQRDITNGFGWMLLGKPVHIDENMPKIAAGSVPIVYGDMSGLYVKLAQNVELQVLTEKYATQHAIGVCGYVEADSKIVEPQKIRTLKMKTA